MRIILHIYTFILFTSVVNVSFAQLDKELKISWVDIPAGSFIMGSPENEIGRDVDEKQHKVTLSPFKMSRYEVTYDQYMAFCKATGRVKPDSDGLKKGDYPIVNVNWEDADAFAKWIGGRLPTEAEWEYACRAGTQSTFYTGDNLTTSQANFDGNYPYNRSAKSPAKGKIMPVGSYPPNRWGLHDMHGNVWEWVADWYVSDLGSDDVVNPKGPRESQFDRVGRGGSYYEGANENRCADRGGQSATISGNNLGFRIVKD